MPLRRECPRSQPPAARWRPVRLLRPCTAALPTPRLSGSVHQGSGGLTGAPTAASPPAQPTAAEPPLGVGLVTTQSQSRVPAVAPARPGGPAALRRGTPPHLKAPRASRTLGRGKKQFLLNSMCFSNCSEPRNPFSKHSPVPSLRTRSSVGARPWQTPERDPGATSPHGTVWKALGRERPEAQPQLRRRGPGAALSHVENGWNSTLPPRVSGEGPRRGRRSTGSILSQPTWREHST